MTFYLWVLQHAYSSNKDILLHNRTLLSNVRKFIVIPKYHLISIPYSVFPIVPDVFGFKCFLFFLNQDPAKSHILHLVVCLTNVLKPRTISPVFMTLTFEETRLVVLSHDLNLFVFLWCLLICSYIKGGFFFFKDWKYYSICVSWWERSGLCMGCTL